MGTPSLDTSKVVEREEKKAAKTRKKGGLPSVEPTTLQEAVEKENAKIDDNKVLFEMEHVLYSRAKGVKIVSSSLKVRTTVR